MAAEAKAPLLQEARRGATPAQTIGNIVVSIVGTGVLGLPYAFRTAGWLAGALGVAGAGAATFYCMLLLRQEQETEEDGEQHRCCNYTYGDLGERCFGRIGRHFTEATIILSQTGGTVAYLVFIGQNVSSVFATEDGHGPLTPATVVLALLLPVQAALSLVRSLSSLGQFSILADACTVLAVATVVKQDLQLLAARGEQPFQGRDAVAGLWGVAFAAGFSVFCFEGFCMTLALEASMADRSRFRSVLLQAITGVTAVYVVLCIALALTFPVMMHPIHEIVEARLLAPGGWLRKRCHVGGAMERAALHASRVAVLVALSAISCFVPAFGSFASFVGSTVCALLSFVLPALFHLRVVGHAAGAAQRAVDWAILLFGLAFAAHGLYDAVLSRH
ncbi:unnamed protein product [Miscanthus lutarioriparius]|uniref:Amino acid transporter transmembrane domain-containing protein n=1 Tax=Miscanthus lutarioriparius TaxID=422564 RepID=A0A811MPF2_9POAL|nr:unnamed protein product [Miscanthus lutarioriparius]